MNDIYCKTYECYKYKKYYLIVLAGSTSIACGSDMDVKIIIYNNKVKIFDNLISRIRLHNLSINKLFVFVCNNKIIINPGVKYYYYNHFDIIPRVTLPAEEYTYTFNINLEYECQKFISFMNPICIQLGSLLEEFKIIIPKIFEKVKSKYSDILFIF
jgi:hypothetical protein